ncbi:hypothetical protein [Pseudoalteromonas sp. T1lg48]|uniref:hypothetical protein n=1 Tax=Pseudoalteromonas sp. T1lg48 TaxID=2077100 RepID=UPI000CF5E7DA|nr:hypothetical protein [Pseudoalteromonas sp. T1lg48]
MKKYLVPASLALLATLSTTAQADNGVNIQALKACSYIENDFRRLLCYDNIMAGKPIDSMPANAPAEVPAQSQKGKGKGPSANAAGAAAGATAGAGAAASAASNKGNNSKREFGLEHKQKDDNDGNPDELVAKVSQVKEAPYGELIITLDNGQRWRQIGTDSFRISKNDTVVISRAMFNSFLLKKQGSNKSIRVKRTD